MTDRAIYQANEVNEFRDNQQASSWQGNLELKFTCKQDTTQLIHCLGKAPLKLQRPFYPEGPQICHGVILHTAGGVVGGDRLSLDIHLDADTQVLLTQAAASKIYRSEGLEAHQQVRITLEPGAWLEWLPRETIVFNQAHYHQDLRVELATGAVWLGWEITRLGRTARGEQFLQGHWRSHTEVWQQGTPLWIDPQWLPGGEELLKSYHGLGGYPVVGTLALIGQPAEAELIAQIRQLWNAEKFEGETGVTRLMSGLLCRYRGFSTQSARNWFMQVWHLLRLHYRHQPACQPRIWQL